MPTNLLCNLKTECHFPCDIKDLRSLCEATLIRAAICDVKNWREMLVEFRNLNGNVNSNLWHLHPEWLENAAVKLFSQSVDKFDFGLLVEFAGQGNYGIHDIGKIPKFQMHVYNQIKQLNAPFSLREALRYRFLKREWFEEDDIEYYVERCCLFLNDIHKSVPPCVFFSVIVTFFNGWTTSARFQSIDKVCLLCSHCDGEDSLEHYSCCRFQWRSFSSICWHASLPCKLSRFLGLETDCINVKVWHACHMYAVKGAVDHRRRGNIVSGPEHVNALVRQGYRRACIHHKSLAKEFANIWAS